MGDAKHPAKILSLPTNLQVTRLTVFYILLVMSAVSTAATVPMSETARTEYDGARKVDCDEEGRTNWITVSLNIW